MERGRLADFFADERRVDDIVLQPDALVDAHSSVVDR
jgi:hypothetical protein